MTLQIISCNNKAVKIGVIFHYVTLLVLIVYCIPGVGEVSGNSLLYIASFFFIVGISLVNYYLSQLNQIGSIRLQENTTMFLIDRTEIEIVNSEFSVKFSKSGYEGQSKITPFLTGAFTSNSGINSLCFYNERQKFEYKVIIRSELEYKNVINQLANNYVNYNEKSW